MTHDERIARAYWSVMVKCNEAMDAELANAKNKRGIVTKYRYLIPPAFLLESDDPWPDIPGEAGVFYAAGVAIGMCMHERLEKFAAENA